MIALLSQGIRKDAGILPSVELYNPQKRIQLRYFI